MNSETPKNTIRELSRLQRRVLGTLMEKGFTTPDQYPMTLKGTMTGCNQKSNRDPVTEYSEGEVADALEQLRQMGLVAEVFTDGGRTARYRHYMRHGYDFSEAQFAIIAELLLRGRQQPGELRTRASRMVRIDSQEQLKSELQSLQEKGFVQSSGSLERRGVEVDHTYYPQKERRPMAQLTDSEPAELAPTAPVAPRPTSASPTSVPAAASQESGILRQLHDDVRELTAGVSRLQSALEALEQRVARIERDLGI